MGERGTPTILHGSCVALGPAAVLILGASGTGKSALALELLSRGAVLVADDRTVIRSRDGALFASCPSAIRGRIEARGVGILAAETVASARVALAVDLDQVEDQRLPPDRCLTLEGVALPLLHSTVHGHFPAAILQYLRGGRSA
ncbi:MAG: HPr kinase/phosphatase C-terminal domain-containing protein [Paracoccaceae bacterium]